MSLILATLNIEHGRHLPELFEFISKEQPDILCLQEVFALDVELIKNKLRYIGFFSPTTNFTESHGYAVDSRGIWGQMIMLRLGLVEDNINNMVQEHYYTGSRQDVSKFNNPESINHVLQVVRVKKDGRPYTIGNTHFTWSAMGQASKLQRQHFQALQQFLDLYPEMLLCGDFNAPRGGEIFQLFTKYFTDNLPPDIQTTIDKNFHYSGRDLKLAVDNIFSTPNYQLSNVRVICGLSDHCAVIGLVK